MLVTVGRSSAIGGPVEVSMVKDTVWCPQDWHHRLLPTNLLSLFSLWEGFGTQKWLPRPLAINLSLLIVKSSSVVFFHRVFFFFEQEIQMRNRYRIPELCTELAVRRAEPVTPLFSLAVLTIKWLFCSAPQQHTQDISMGILPTVDNWRLSLQGWKS